MAISVAIFVISGLPCAYYLYVRSQIDTSYTMESEIAAGNSNYDKSSMESLSAEWSNFERSGLGPKEKPWFYFLKAYAYENQVLAAVTGSIAALAGLVATGVWLTGPKTVKTQA